MSSSTGNVDYCNSVCHVYAHFQVEFIIINKNGGPCSPSCETPTILGILLFERKLTVVYNLSIETKLNLVTKWIKLQTINWDKNHRKKYMIYF